MKTFIGFIAVSFIFLYSCNSLKSSTSGKENEAFLEFIGNASDYPGGINVNLDDNNNFIAILNKDRIHSIKATVYSIPTGTHTVTVTFNNQVILKKQIFVSNQETRKITLK